MTLTDPGPLVALICGDNDMEVSGRGTSRTPAGHAGSSRRRELLSVRGLAAEGAVEAATLTVHEGEILGIAGLVGSGRTELARALFGAERIKAGSVHFRGQPLRLRSPRDAIRAGIALLPEERQSEGILKTFSLRENVTISSLPRHRIQPLVPVSSLRSERATAKDAIARLKVSAPGAETDIELLSGGNQQKVLFAK